MSEPNPSGSDQPAEEANCPIAGFNSIEEFVQSGFKTLIEGTKNANKLPIGKSRDFYETCPAFHRIMKQQGEAVLTQLSRVMKHAGSKGNIQRRDEEERFEMIVDANDTIFERVGTLLDDLAGIRRNPNAEIVAKVAKNISGSWNKQKLTGTPNKKHTEVMANVLNASKHLEKPQIHFNDAVDNARNTPFSPRINFKHNLLKPLALLYEADEEHGQYSHPYEFELEKWKPSDEQLKPCTPQMYRPLEETPIVYLDKPEQIEGMLQHLREADALALDLEHHSYRTFQGITCLMQISTREKDFIVDTIALRSDLQPLNEIFTDPKKLKILHGAQCDIQWLQRDLALYIVNMFDTHIASRHLGYSVLSLAYLLNKFCDVQAMKHFQLADWRVRPLPEEMLQYAREDTHYLLYIYDMMKNELLEKANGQDNLLRAVYTESNQLCLTRYVKPIWRPDDHLHLYHKSKRLFDNRQLYALKELYDWRDKTAREYDESIGYVLPNHMLLHIAQTLPREVQGIIACCNPVPPLVRQNLTPIHLLIRKAREQPLVRPVIEPSQQVDRNEGYGITVDSPLRCPHDLAWVPEFRSDLPVLINGLVPAVGETHSLLLEKPSVTVFEGDVAGIRKSKESTILTPYQRYKMAKPYADSLANAEVAKDAEVTTTTKVDTKPVVKKEKKAPKEPLPLRKQFEKNERKKLKVEENEEVAPKIAKVEEELSIVSVVPQAETLPPRKPSEVPPKTKKKKGKGKEPDPTFQSFNYSNVDYGKFQSNSIDKVTHKQKRIKNKHKRTGKKKFKVAI